MSGEIIYFRNFHRRCLPEDQFVSTPSWDVAPHHRSDKSDPAFQRKRVLRLQVARIGRLLDELEDLITTSDGRGSGIIRPSRGAIKKARKILQQWPEALRDAQPIDGEEDPQPEIDRAVLERMYQSLNSDA